MTNIFYLSDLQQNARCKFYLQAPSFPLYDMYDVSTAAALRKKTCALFFSSLNTVLYVGQGVRVVFIRTRINTSGPRQSASLTTFFASLLKTHSAH